MRPGRYALPSLIAILSVTFVTAARADVLNVPSAQKEGDFHNSFAINVHPNYAGADLYQFYDPAFSPSQSRTTANTWKTPLCQSGIPFIRASVFGSQAQFGKAQEDDLYSSCGIRMIGMLGDATGFKWALDGIKNGLYAPGELAYLELMNEPGNTGQGREGWLEAYALSHWQQENGTSYPVIGPSPTSTAAAQGIGDISAYVDYGNIHPYSGGGPPENALPANTARSQMFAPGKQPMVTEQGFWTFDTDGGLGQAPFNLPTQNGVTEAVQATYGLRMYAENFRVFGPGEKTAAYELLDEWGPEKVNNSNGNGTETRFGILRGDFTPKPAYNAIKELLRYENETTTSFTPAPVDVTVTTPDNTPVNALVLARSNGRDRILAWRPDSVYNQATGVETPVAAVPVTVKVCRPDVTVGMYLDTEYPEDPSTLQHKVGGAVPNVNGCRTWTTTLDGRLKILNPWY
jgi:hypothetical protein